MINYKINIIDEDYSYNLLFNINTETFEQFRQNLENVIKNKVELFQEAKKIEKQINSYYTEPLENTDDSEHFSLIINHQLLLEKINIKSMLIEAGATIIESEAKELIVFSEENFSFDVINKG